MDDIDNRPSSNGSGSVSSRPRFKSSGRSKEGCLTCKRRKVKCDEQRPRCSHCERLNMECRWQPASRTRKLGGFAAAPAGGGLPIAPTRSSTNMSAMNNNNNSLGGSSESSTATSSRFPSLSNNNTNTNTNGNGNGNNMPQQAVNRVFDYASFLWEDGADVWPQTGLDHTLAFDPSLMDAEYENPPSATAGANGTTDASDVQPAATDSLQSPRLVSTRTREKPPEDHPSEPSTLSDTGPLADQDFLMQLSAENHRLMDYFIHAVVPPILAEVETQKKWFAVRQVLVAMASASRMVRWAVLAFTNVLLCRRDGAWMASQQNHYENAIAEVVSHDHESSPSLSQHSQHRENLLATLFFLSYVDILESRMEAAQSNLKRAFHIFQQGAKGSFGSLEKQFLLWTRLLDGRAVSAGGEGLFLSKDDEELLTTSPSATAVPEPSIPGASRSTDVLAATVASTATTADPSDIEDILFQLLYQPGVNFFQKVQSFTGRISQIDPWHRSRGTVEDETEVMNLGAVISRDLAALYDSRPLLMDYAVAGSLSPPHVSAQLAFTITRAFRTYLSNFYACQVHLHRVAYKTFPLTREATEAMGQIRKLARLLGEGLQDVEHDALPVNMLWPLLMWGSEEKDSEERRWIRDQILRMERVAGNATITARVLEEVQARQDGGGGRVDIRSVMHAIFDSCFAIV